MKLAEKELKDIANGACLLASGGGGTIQAPEWIIPEILKIAKHVDLIDFDEVAPKSSGAVAVCMGSPLALKAVGFHGSVFRAWDADTARPVAMAPDGIGYVNKNGQALSNADLKKGDKVYVVGVRAQERLRTDAYLKAQFLAGLKNVGYYGKYVPIEDLT